MPSDNDKAISKAIVEMQLNNGTLEKLPDGYLAAFICAYREGEIAEALADTMRVVEMAEKALEQYAELVVDGMDFTDAARDAIAAIAKLKEGSSHA